MSLLEQASLIVTPNAYKEDVLYSVVPNDRSGDLDVVRATTATRVNADGLIEVVPKNLLSYSEQFDNINWSKANLSVIVNATTSPSGLIDADKLVENIGLSSRSLIVPTISITGNVTLTVYAKPSGRDWIIVRDAFGFGKYFNIANGTIGNNYGSAPISSSINDAGNGWYRCSITTNAVSGTRPNVLLSDNGITEVYIGDGTSGVYLWGAQLEANSTATSYFPTTDRLNIPRLDYSGGGCPSILIEGQRTNLALWSEDFSNASWSKSNTTVNSNSAISPDGTQNADKLIETATFTNHTVYSTVAFPPLTKPTISVYAKAGERDFIYLGGLGRTPNEVEGYTFFNLNNGTIGSVQSGCTANIENIGNGWYLCSVTTLSAPTSTQREFRIGISNQNGSQAYQGDGTSGIFLWGAQLEAGSYATSYIPTVAATSTRNADVISKTGISGLIGQTEGTMFFNGNYKQLSTTARFITISNATNSNLVQFYTPANSSSLRGYIAINGTLILDTAIKNLNISEFFKIAIAYKSGATKIYIDGQLLITNSIIYTTGIFNVLNFANQSNNSHFEGQVKNLQLYKTALTDEQCILLTGDSYASYAEMANALNYIIQ